ncbi:hypothetical protein M446_3386 [Methylobacterium sp. 4-46]|uniref:hypothetical protein n=1 Tax=unclassified Methylobacterium TaxID=2615210 RepID=UPI000152DCD6|nr:MULTISPECIES: hypothetical protein [Methylobacterium]ACA17776.1 hypothetical protein M446_3386 [Methylobacterium sp. 4-46]WFT83444.1 hypothetical protein QA634_17140 [Methylobacterium nodulans]
MSAPPSRAALAAAKARGQVLGGFRGKRFTPADHAAAAAGRRARGERNAQRLAPALAELRAAGVTSAAGLARALTERGIPTARGATTWRVTQVQNLPRNFGQSAGDETGRDMGGVTSGNWGGRPTVESCLALDLPKPLRDRIIQPGHTRVGTLTWTSRYPGQPRASVTSSATLGQDRGHVRLLYRTTRRRTLSEHDETVAVLATPQPLGGQRWWFLCPLTGRRTSRLDLPLGATGFAARQAYRLAYRSQRESPRNRAISRAFKLRHQLGDSDGAIGDGLDKPKSMHAATFQRKIARHQRAEDLVHAHAAALFGTAE